VTLKLAMTLTPKNETVLRLGTEQLERYDEALRLLAEGDRAPPQSFARPGLRAFFRLAALWKLTDDEQSGLLGNPPPATFETWKANSADEVPPETLIRISYCLGIFQALGKLYPDNLANNWLKLPNSNAIYGGEAPIAYMLRNGIEGLRVTRRLLEARVHG